MSDETGIENPAEVHQFVEETYGGAVSSMSAENRASQVMQAVNERLAAAGVPHVDWSWGSDPGNAGQFHYRTWSMGLGRTPFDPATYEVGHVADHADLLDTVYHEARHSEQWFRQARERAGLGATAAQIVETTHIPQHIADAAVADPITQSDKSQYEAEQWYQSIYGSGAHHRDEVLSDVDNHYQEYRDLPEEADAWKAGGEVTGEYKERGEAGNN